MAPSSSPLGDATQSTLLTTSSLVIPVIIVVSSVAVISSVLLIVVLAITLHRRIREQQHATANAEAVPRLVITDTSMFPASTVVVEGEAALDQMIASFKPLGAESLVMEEPATVKIRRVHYEDEEEEEDELYPLPKISRSRAKNIPIFERSCLAHRNCDNIKADFNTICHRDGRPICSSANLPSGPQCVQTLEGVWWHDFHMEQESLESQSHSSLSEAGSTSESFSSTNSNCNVPALMKSEYSAGALARVAGQNAEATSGVGRTSTALSYNLADDSEDKSQDTLYDKDILAYCWRLSDDGSGRNLRSLSSLCDAKVTDHDMTTTMVASRSKAVTIRTYPTSEAFDQRILEYCWKISENPSLKNIDHISNSESVTVRFTTSTRPVSGASIPGLAITQLHDSEHLVFPWDIQFSNEGGGSKGRLSHHILTKDINAQAGSERAGASILW